MQLALCTKGGDGVDVYILDDYRQEREQIVKWLREHTKIRVEVFEDHQHLLERIKNSPSHLSIIRLGNNGIPGLKTAEMIKKENPETKIVFLAEDRDYALDAYEVGADGYLLEPLEKEKLEQAFLSLKKQRDKAQKNSVEPTPGCVRKGDVRE